MSETRFERFPEPRVEMWDDRWLIAKTVYGYLYLPPDEKLLITSQEAADALEALLSDPGPRVLREAADDWEKTANDFEALDPPMKHPKWAFVDTRKMMIESYRWAAAMLRGRARSLELQRCAD